MVAKVDLTGAIELYNSGLTTQQVADKFNCSRFPVEKLLRKNGIKVRSNKIGENFTEQILELYNSGKSILQIQELLGLKRDPIVLQLTKNGISFIPMKIQCAERNNNNSPCWKGYKELSGVKWKGVIKNARKRNIPVLINIEQAWDQWEKQNGICSISGLKLKHQRNTKELGTASLDRIDSSIAYTVDNIQWVHKRINAMRLHFPMWYFLLLCKLVVSPIDINFSQQATSSDVTEYFSCIKSHHKSHKRRSARFDFSLEKEELINLYNYQNGKCSLTGLPIFFRKKENKNYLNNIASVDRINNEDGYNLDNIHIVHKNINLIRSINTMQEFREYCKIITENQATKT